MQLVQTVWNHSNGNTAHVHVGLIMYVCSAYVCSVKELVTFHQRPRVCVPSRVADHRHLNTLAHALIDTVAHQ